MSENELIKISEDEIKAIIAGNYGVRPDDVCLYHDYEFVKRGGDKSRNDYIYGIVDLRNSGLDIIANGRCAVCGKELGENRLFVCEECSTKRIDYLFVKNAARR